MKKILFLLFTIVCLSASAQLRKAASIEKVKSFTNGSVVLNKTTIDSVAIYSVTLKNNSRLHENVVFFLGTKEEMLKNLKDLSSAIESGKKGDVFEFSASKVDYILSYDKVLGQACFKVSKPYYTASNFGRLYKATIKDIIEYFEKNF